MNRTFQRFIGTAVTFTAIVGSGCARRESNRALDPTNELPFGVVDTPKEGATVGTPLSTSGWALDDRGVREVRVYVDGHFANLTHLNTPRPDVKKAFPQYTQGGDTVGWSATVDLQGPGVHMLVVQAVDSDGATRDIGSIKVMVQ
jgi:hypothetical protein